MSLLQVHLVICSSFLSLANKAGIPGPGLRGCPQLLGPHSQQEPNVHETHFRAGQPLFPGELATSSTLSSTNYLGASGALFKEDTGNSLVVSSG